MFLLDMLTELEQSRQQHGAVHSHHEGWAVLTEEVEEYWEEVRRQTHLRNDQAIYHELVQIATVAWRIALDLGLAAGAEHTHALLQVLAQRYGYASIPTAGRSIDVPMHGTGPAPGLATDAEPAVPGRGDAEAQRFYPCRNHQAACSHLGTLHARDTGACGHVGCSCATFSPLLPVEEGTP